MDGDVILVIVVATALAFDFTNGFHDTANAVATSISTRAMSPRAAVAHGRDPELRRRVHLARGRGDGRERHRRRSRRSRRRSSSPGLIGAIAWNLITWYFGLPSSSSHALIGGVAGAAFVAAGAGRGARRRAAREGRHPRARRAAARVLRRGHGDPHRLPDRRAACAPGPVNRGYRLGQIVSGSLFSPRPRHERRAEDDGHHHARAHRPRRPARRRASRSRSGSSSRRRPRSRSGRTRAAGGSSARWAAGSSRWTPAQGFSAQGAGAAVVLTASHLGFPLSTTHVISGGGHGRGRREAAVRRPLGRRRQHRARLGAHAAVLGGDRRARLRRDADLRHRRARPGRRLALGHRAHRRDVRPRARSAAPRSRRPRRDRLRRRLRPRRAGVGLASRRRSC